MRESRHRGNQGNRKQEVDEFSEEEIDFVSDNEENDDQARRALHKPGGFGGKSPASPLPSPGRARRAAGDRPRQMHPPASPRLLQSRSPQNLSQRSPSPTTHKAAGKEYIAYFEEDIDLEGRSKQTDKKREKIPSLGSSKDRPKTGSNRRRDKSDFDWNDYVSPSASPRDSDNISNKKQSSRRRQSDDDFNWSDYSEKQSPRFWNEGEEEGVDVSPRSNQGSEKRRHSRKSTGSPPLSPMSSSGGSSRSPWESPRSNKDSLDSSGEYSPRDGKLSARHGRRKNLPTGGKLEPLNF